MKLSSISLRNFTRLYNRPFDRRPTGNYDVAACGDVRDDIWGCSWGDSIAAATAGRDTSSSDSVVTGLKLEAGFLY